jgi:hypothetical protein
VKEVDVGKPPDDCPNCGGETEWESLTPGREVAVCYFCGLKFHETPKST